MECDEPIEITPGQGGDLREDDDLDNSPAALPPSQETVHAEVRLARSSTATREAVRYNTELFVRARGVCNTPLFIDSFSTATSSELQDFFDDNVASISLETGEHDCPISHDSGGLGTQASAVNLKLAPLAIHVYRLVSGDEADPTHETIEVSSEVIKGGTRWLLPSPTFDGLWDSLVYDSTVKRDLLKYSESALLFADCEVSQHVISWNRVIFLHGPPGTGKTSLCRALAQKLAIRLSHRFSSAALIEINTVNLMSKWFSESARLVSQMFASILEYLEEPDNLVCLLVDEVETLTVVRNSVSASCEPSDAIRVVNAVLTHLDQLKQRPNVLVMATSNVTGILDPAFLDRADIRAYIGPPSAVAIYTIYISCLNELIRVGLIKRPKSGFLNFRVLSALRFAKNSVTEASLAVWRLAQSSVGLNGRTLRKLPLLAHAFHMKTTDATTSTCRHLSTCPDYPENQETAGRRGAVGIPFGRFIEALERAASSQIADQKLIDEASSVSQMGRRVKGATKTTSMGANV